jgi:hypothetical protein
MNKNTFVNATAILLAGIFLYAAANKLIDFKVFRSYLSATPIPFVAHWAPSIAWLIPAGLICNIGLLIYTRTRLIGLFAGLFDCSVFACYIICLRRTGQWMADAHEGILFTHSWNGQLLMNLVLSAAAITAIMLHRRNRPSY